MKKKTISIFTVGWGHKSIAKSIEQYLKKSKKYNVFFNQLNLEKAPNDIYVTTYRYFPGLNKIAFKLSKNKNLARIASKYFFNEFKQELKPLISKQKPNLIINCYLSFLPVFENLTKKYNFEIFNIVANPRTFSSLEISKGFPNLVLDKVAKQNCKKLGVLDKNIIECGWFVRKKFRDNYNLIKVRKSLSFPTDILTMLIIGGSEGANIMLKALPAFLKTPKPVHVIFICGKNKQMYSTTKIISQLITSNKKSKVHFTILGYTNRVHKYMQASDVVIGKAGPNMLFESIATKTPFFSLGHIAGQEDGNLDIIKEYKLGFVKEKQTHAVKLIKDIIKYPEILKRFDKPLAKMAKHNEGSGKILLDRIDKII